MGGLDQQLIDAAIQFTKQRFPGDKAWEGAAALRTSDGQILISTAPAVVNASVELCHEASGK